MFDAFLMLNVHLTDALDCDEQGRTELFRKAKKQWGDQINKNHLYYFT